MQPFQSVLAHATLIKMHCFFRFDQMLFDLLIDRCHQFSQFDGCRAAWKVRECTADNGNQQRALAEITESDPGACNGLLGMLNLDGSDSIYSFEAQKMLFKREGEALRRCPGARQRLCRYLGLLDGTRLDWPPMAVSQVCQAAKAVLVRFGPASASCGGVECRL